MADLCVALLVSPAAYWNKYASDFLVARLDLAHFEQPSAVAMIQLTTLVVGAR